MEVVLQDRHSRAVPQRAGTTLINKMFPGLIFYLSRYIAPGIGLTLFILKDEFLLLNILFISSVILYPVQNNSRTKENIESTDFYASYSN
jgi:hypothetical protein